jgi:class 3 adenylate cyclase/tetratricopeptide (TPR) repeat protein
MQCPKCQFQNREEALFCKKCGHTLEITCPKCGNMHPANSIFCDKCGQSLTSADTTSVRELSFDEKIQKIQKYLPGGLTEKILAQRGKIEGERKQVTVLFADMENFTPLVEKLGPEEAYAIMDQVYEILIHKVHDFEGTVNEMTGDGVMALFGAPIALEDAPQRAIRSAIAIHREMTGFNDRMKQEKEDFSPIKMRIGIHAGPVVVGTLGNDLRVEFKAVGDTVNLASRMESLAEPGTTYVSDDTFRLTEGFFRFEALGEREIKGKEKPVRVYQVIAPSSRRTRFDVNAERGLTPFVDRERELALLIDCFERAKAGRGQAITIVSEAGIGKSRLLYEFRKAVTNEDVTFLEGRCLSYSRNVAYHPVVDILKSNYDIQDTDSDHEIKEKVIRGLKIMKVDEASTLPYLLALLSVKDSGIDILPMSHDAKKDRIIESLKRIVFSESEIRPFVMAIEDVHWIDKSSENALKSLLDSISGFRILLIFTYRPQFAHSWGGKSYHSQVNLNRLSNSESLTMVSYILETEKIKKDLEELILSKAEGIPFFIEEFIKSLKNLKIIELKNGKLQLFSEIMHATVPSTVQDVIMAGVDLLPEGAKEILRTGSVIEREFRYELIKKVMSMPEQELLSNLSLLKSAELLYERGIHPQSFYIFRHALTREVVYESILTKKRKKLHEEIGYAIEALYRDDLGEYYGQLADHFFESENFEKAAEYSNLAGIKAERIASFTDAITHAKKRVTSLEMLPKTAETQSKIIDARINIGYYLTWIGQFAEAKETIEPIIDTTIQGGHTDKLSRLYTIMGIYNYIIEEDISKSLKNLEEAVKISEVVYDIYSFGFANYQMGLVLCWDCEFDKTSHYTEKALQLAFTPWRVSILKSNFSVSYNYRGALDEGFDLSSEALKLAEESGDVLSKAYAYTQHGMSLYYKGFFEEAEKHLLTGIEYSERVNLLSHLALANQWLGHTYFEMKKYEQAQQRYENTIYLRRQSRLFPSSINLNKIALARAKVLNNDKNIDLESLYRFVLDNKVKLYSGWMARFIGNILMHIDDNYLTEAGGWIQKAIEADKKNGMIMDMGIDYLIYAEWFKKKGALLKIGENLDKAKNVFIQCGANEWITKVDKIRSHL